jgi:hypothetical protein
LESLVDLQQLGVDTDTTGKVTDDHVQTWLNKFQAVKKYILSATQVGVLVSKSLRTRLSEQDPDLRIVLLFSDYTKLLRAQGLTWILTENTKVAVSYIVGALRTLQLQQRIKDDLEFSHKGLNRGFHAFMLHVTKRAVSPG